MTEEEKRKNLVVVRPKKLEEAVREKILREPERLLPEDYRFWERNDRIIEEIYSHL